MPRFNARLISSEEGFMERTRHISDLVQRLETPPFRDFVWGHAACSKQTVIMPHVIAHAPMMRVYGSIDGLN